jgi:hypothetical protein
MSPVKHCQIYKQIRKFPSNLGSLDISAHDTSVTGFNLCSNSLSSTIFCWEYLCYTCITVYLFSLEWLIVKNQKVFSEKYGLVTDGHHSEPVLLNIYLTTTDIETVESLYLQFSGSISPRWPPPTSDIAQYFT